MPYFLHSFKIIVTNVTETAIASDVSALMLAVGQPSQMLASRSAMCVRECLLFIFCLSFSQIDSASQNTECGLDLINRDKEKFAPLLLYNHTTYFELPILEKGIINLNTGDRITVACTGARNYLTATNSNSSNAVCVRENTLQIVRKNFEFEDLTCTKDIRGDVRKTGRKCVNGEGYIKEIGYQVTRINWVPLLEVCYDDTTGVTFYSQHFLRGREIKYSSRNIERPSFSTDGLGPGIAATVAYTKRFQKSTFNKILGSARLAEYYINSKSYLARGHLSPDADFPIGNLKRATYYYINVCPQWQVINAGNWKSVETSIRKTAEGYGRTFTIITGTHGVLSLPDVNRNPVPLYLLSGSKLPIPQLIWKIAYDPETELGIVFTVVNNPFVSKVSQNDIICENICDQYGWGTTHWTDVSRGYIYCCDVNEFLRVVNTAPSLSVRGILEANNSLLQYVYYVK